MTLLMSYVGLGASEVEHWSGILKVVGLNPMSSEGTSSWCRVGWYGQKRFFSGFWTIHILKSKSGKTVGSDLHPVLSLSTWHMQVDSTASFSISDVKWHNSSCLTGKPHMCRLFFTILTFYLSTIENPSHLVLLSVFLRHIKLAHKVLATQSYLLCASMYVLVFKLPMAKNKSPVCASTLRH